ncbi:Na+/H+ antiporter NhaC family protein [candidate division KSB1 bacterium]|nr:Na+/H+ antiporter NhaC family protein [candidate division KSB1 bacterium]
MKNSLLALAIFALVLMFITHSLLSDTETVSPSKLLKAEAPVFVLSNVPFELRLTALTPAGARDSSRHDEVHILGCGIENEPMSAAAEFSRTFSGGTLVLKKVIVADANKNQIRISTGTDTILLNLNVVPGITKILPPVLAIILALAARQVLVALFCGIWLGATLHCGLDPLQGFMRVLDTYLIKALSHPDHVAIVMFSMTLGGMVGIMSKSGGTAGIIEKVTQYADHPRGGQLASWFLGVLIFFDDYANTLIVGNTMRPFTDRLKISREKLSFIVDSTAAPVASLFPISTWVGFQIGLIGEAFQKINITADPYITFVESIPYASYSVITLCFVFLVGLTLRDYGPMLKSEIRSRRTGKVIRDDAQPLTDTASLDFQAADNIPCRWYNALIPIFTVIIVTLAGLYYSGITNLGPAAGDANLGDIIGEANSFHVLMWASFSGALAAIILAVGQRLLRLKEALESWLSGVKSMALAMIILVLAWAIGDVCADIKTADYVIDLSRGMLSPHYMPIITFIIAAFIGFSTGTSWATMAILIPIVLPISHKLSLDAAIDPVVSHSIMLGTIGAVLSGSVFGDHSSPISDTTIMSSMASAADHIDHVRTQLPYAFSTALVACVVGYLPAGFGFNIYVGLAIGILLLLAGLFIFGKSAYAKD